MKKVSLPDIPKLPERNRFPNSNQVNPKQYNPAQINPSQLNPNQVIQQQYNPNQVNPSQVNQQQNFPMSVSSTNNGQNLNSHQERPNVVPRTFGVPNKKNIETKVTANVDTSKIPSRLTDLNNGAATSIAKPIYNFSTSNQQGPSLNKVGQTRSRENVKPEVSKPGPEKLIITVNLVQPKSNPSSISSNPRSTGFGRTVILIYSSSICFKISFFLLLYVC